MKNDVILESPLRWGKTLLVLALCSLVGCQKSDTEKLKRVGLKSKQKLSKSTASARSKLTEGIESLQPGASTPSLQRRLDIRLQWDKALTKENLTAIIKPGGVAEIRGRVASDSQKQRALELTKSTVGVTKVIDAIDVKPAQP